MSIVWSSLQGRIYADASEAIASGSRIGTHAGILVFFQKSGLLSHAFAYNALPK